MIRLHSVGASAPSDSAGHQRARRGGFPKAGRVTQSRYADHDASVVLARRRLDGGQFTALVQIKFLELPGPNRLM